MNIYKAPNLIISPKRKVYRRGGEWGHSMMNPSTHTHSLSPLSPRLSLSPSDSPEIPDRGRDIRDPRPPFGDDIAT